MHAPYLFTTYLKKKQPTNEKNTQTTTYLWIHFTPVLKCGKNKDDIWGTSIIQFLREKEGRKKLRPEITSKPEIFQEIWPLPAVSIFVLPLIFDFVAFTLSLPVWPGNTKPDNKVSLRWSPSFMNLPQSCVFISLLTLSSPRAAAEAVQWVLSGL